MAVDTDSQLITAVDVLPGNARDSVGALELVEQSEENTGIEVEETIGDCAYGDGATRQTFAEADRTLVATKMGMMGKVNQPAASFFALFYRGFTISVAALMLRLPAVAIPLPVLITSNLRSTEGGFRLNF